MSEEPQINVAHFISEVLGGTKLYIENGGNQFGIVKEYFQKNLTVGVRKRCMALLLETEDELDLPDASEVRSAFVDYLEWGTRLALLNSNVDEIGMHPAKRMATWG
ncbi:MAG TPA: hypothetical protein VFD35_10720 [Pricia sp.]|nr:hypothetical protein [Pricia sp.]